MSDKRDPKTNEPLTGHNYDGIEEADNPLPNWWLMTLYLSIAFAIGYYAYYEIGEGPSLREELHQDLAQLEARKSSGPVAKFPDEKLLAAAGKDKSRVVAGSEVFKARCISCHGDKGQGLIGPNLTDDYWLHGDGKLKAIAMTIHDGVAEKGMPPWGPILSEKEIYEVAAYVRSLRGTNPAGAKAPQGPQYKE
jgi:cytochrome c oxidase cbb3-type subunit 3